MKTPRIPEDFSDIDFWMLNDRLDPEEILRQMTEMKKNGIRSLIARTYIGLESDYPGPEFKDLLLHIVRTARELDMKIFLQAGYMPNAIPDLAENLRAQHLEYKDGRVEKHTDKMILDILNPESVAHYLKVSYEDMWREFEPFFGNAVLSIWVDEPSYPQWKVPYSNALVPEFLRMWGYDPEGHLEQLFEDTTGAETFRYQYRETVIRCIERAYFAQMRDYCRKHGLLCSGHLLYEESLSGNIACCGAVMPAYKYFDIPGIDVLTASTDFERYPLEERFPAPDMKNANHYLVPIQCVSAANQAGRKHILCEMYGVSSENFALREQKNMYDRYAAFGITRRCVHGLFYSLRGRRKRAYPPHIHYYQPYWNDYKKLVSDCGETAEFIARGAPVRDILVIHPMGTAQAKFNFSKGFASLEREDRALQDLTVFLTHAQCRFDLGDEETIAESGKAGDGIFSVGPMDYKAVLLPNMEVMMSSTLALLEKFIASGGIVWCLGKYPHLLDGIPEPEKIAAGLAGACIIETTEPVENFPRDYSLESDAKSMLIVNHRRDDAGDYFFIFNCDYRSAHSIHLSMNGRAVFREENRREIPLPRGSAEIPEGGSLRLTVRKTQDTQSVPEIEETPDAPEVKKIFTGTWRIAGRDTENVLLLEFMRYRKSGSDEWSARYPILAIDEILVRENYRGPLELRCEIDCAKEFSGTALALELPGEQKVILNGAEVSAKADGVFAAREFSKIPLPVLKKGRNILEIKREYAPLEKFKNNLTSLFEKLRGTELEAMYLTGNFAVENVREYTRTNCLRIRNEFRLTEENHVCNGDLIAAGYPFYPGTMTLEREFHVDDPGCGKTVLELPAPDAALVRVTLNGIPQGVLAWFPYRLELSGLRRGQNTIRLEVTSTLRNLIGPWHRPRGEYGECFGGYMNPNLNWVGNRREDGSEIPEWYDHRIPDTEAWCESYQIVRFGADKNIILATEGTKEL